MMKKNLLFISLLLILFISLGAVSAADMSVDDMDSVDNTQNMEIGQGDLGQEDVENIKNMEIGQGDLGQEDVEITRLQEDPAPISELREKINSAEAGATITLDKDYKATGNGIYIYKSLTIDGQGHTIEGITSYGIFTISRDYDYNINNVIIKNINFVNTESGYGSAIYCDGSNCSVVNCSFVNCAADQNGGAIYCLGDTCNIVNCSFVNCSSISGGAIYASRANCSVVNCSFVDCSETSHGGAIYLKGDNDIVSGCNFSNCSSTNEGGAIYLKGDNGIVSGCNFSNCKSNQYGGAIYWNGDNGIVSGCNFINCSSISGGAIYWCENILNGFIGDCSFINCTAVSSSAIDWNGANGVINYNIFDNNVQRTGGNIIDTKYSINCDFNFFAFEKNTQPFPVGLVGGSTVNNWVVLNIIRDNDNYSVDFVSNDGSTLTKPMPDYSAKLNINEDVKEITIKHNNFKDAFVFGDYVLTSPNSGKILVRNNLKENTTVSVSVENITYGEDAIVNGVVIDVDGNVVSSGDVTLFVNNIKNVTVSVKDGKFSAGLTGLNVGVYNIIVVYTGNNIYSASNATTTNLTVNNATGSFNIDVKDIVYGDNFIINITNAIGVNDEKLSGIVKVVIGDKEYDVAVTDGSGCKVVDDTLSCGEYSVSASLSVHNYDVMESHTSFIVKKVDTVVSVSADDICYGDVAFVNGTVKDVKGNVVSSGDVTLFVNNIKNVTVSVKDGKFSADLAGLNVGVYNIIVVYDGDSNYSPSNISANLTVNNATGSFNIDVKDIVYGDNFIIDITNATGVNGILLNGTVDVTIDGNVYSFNVTDGVASYEVSDILPAGNYRVDASLVVPNYDVMVANTSFIIDKISTKFVDATNGTVYNGKYYSVRLTDDSGNALASKDVTVKIAGKTYNVTTDKNGVAKVKLAITNDYIGKSLKVTYKFIGDNTFKASSGSSTIKVIKTATKITNATKLVVKNHKNFYVKLTTKSGKALANKVVTMKSSVSGKIYKIKTNSKGIAKINLWITYTLGRNHKYTFKYAGSAYYKSYSVTYKIKLVK